MSPQGDRDSASRGEVVTVEWSLEGQGGPHQKDWDEGSVACGEEHVSSTCSGSWCEAVEWGRVEGATERVRRCSGKGERGPGNTGACM